MKLFYFACNFLDIINDDDYFNLKTLNLKEYI